MLKNDVIDRTVGLQGLLGNLGAGLVSDNRVQGSHYSDTVLHHVEATLPVDRDTVDALSTEGIHDIGQPGDAFHDGFCDDRLHHVELELTGLGREGNGHVITDHLEADLVCNLRDDRIDLSRHDRRSRSLRRKVDLLQTATRTGSQQTQVVANLGKLDCKPLQGTRIAYISTGVRRSFDKIRSCDELLPGEFRHLPGAKLGKARLGIQSGTDGSTTHVDFIEEVDVPLEVLDLFGEVGSICMELLAGSHRNGILKLCTSHLDHVCELIPLLPEGIDQVLQALLELPVHPDESITEC